jgi:CRISPR-associated protein Cas2
VSRDGPYRYIIAYDVSDDRRRTLIARRLSSYGQRIQFSVFLVDVRPARIVRLRGMLEQILIPAEDSVLICELGPRERAVTLRMEFLGRQPNLLGSDPVVL